MAVTAPPTLAGRRLITGGLVLTALAVAVQTVAHVISVGLLDNHWALNADSDTGGPAWASSALQSVAAVFVLMLAAERPAAQWMLLGLAAVLAFFSLDDIIAVHERVARLANELNLWDHAGRLVWPVVYLPLLSIAFVGLWLLADKAQEEVGRLIRFGLGALVLAVALEIAAQALLGLGVGRLDAPMVVQVVIEEGAELAGWGMIVTGLAAIVLDASARTQQRICSATTNRPVG